MSNTTNLDLERPDKGATDWTTSLNNNFTKLDTGYGNNVASIADLPEVYVETGTFNYLTGDTITLPKAVDAVNEYNVSVVATTGAGTDIGFIYVTKTTTNFVVKCTGNNTTDTFAATIYYIGDINSYGGSIYRRWYVSPDASITDHGDDTLTGSIAWVLDQIGATVATVELPGNKAYVISTTLVFPDNIHLIFQNGAVLTDDGSNADLTINGTMEADSNQQIFNWGNGSGSVSLSSEIFTFHPEWWGVDGSADDVQINAAITAATANQTIRLYGTAYSCTASIALNKSCTLDLGTTSITSTADPVVQITSDDVTISGINPKESKISNATTLETIIRSPGATRSGITIRNLYLASASTVYGAQGREEEVLIHFGDNPDVGNHTDVVIENCYLTDSLHGILFQFVDDSRIVNNTFEFSHAGNLQINLWACDRVIMQGNTFLDTGGCVGAIEILGSGGTEDPSTQCSIIGNTFSGLYDYEIINLSGNRCIVDGNVLYSNGGGTLQGIQVIQASGYAANQIYENVISNNHIHIANAAAAAAIGLKDNGDNYGVKRCIVSNNIIYYNGGSTAIGMSGQNIDDNLISGNIINAQGNGTDGIYVADSTCIGNIVRGNRISGSGRYGIFLNSPGMTVVDGNEVSGCTSHGIYIAGSATHTISNNVSYSNTGSGIQCDGTGVKAFNSNVAYSNSGSHEIWVDAADACSGNSPNVETLTGTVTCKKYIGAGDIDSSGGAVAVTVLSGLYIGQIHTFTMSDATNPSTVTVQLHRVSDPEIGTFDAVDETWTIIWTGTEWDTIGTPTCTF